MNLHAIASGVIAAVNPPVACVVRVSTGNTLLPGGERVPTYADPQTVQGQVQPLQYRDIQQLDSLNIQGTRRAIYLYGQIDGLVRSENKGGDLIEIAVGPNAGTYLVAIVAEAWPDWCRALVTLQNS